ncbi:MAG: hypothetical protein L0Y71_17810 [Gemmataceae bacterium]|nr:hypothetical protein [Gemmataceae bacterium]
MFVSDVLDQVASGMDWESISQEWDGKVTAPAIREAVQLAATAFLAHADELLVEPAQ